MSKVLLIYKALLISILPIIFTVNQSFATDIQSYNKLVEDWSKIFPDGNRNAASPRFFKYLIDQDLTYLEFLNYNTLFCPVSGSLIRPGTRPTFIFINKVASDERVCGYFYQCCWPCICDVMKYAEAKQINLLFKDGPKEIAALVIDNPCEKRQFPEEINRNYFCDGSKPNKDKVYEIDDKIVIGILHKPSICNNTKMSFVNNHPITGKQCLIRNSTPISELNSGMGDIFIRLAK